MTPADYIREARRARCKALVALWDADRTAWLKIAAGYRDLAIQARRRDRRWAELATRGMLAKLFPGEVRSTTNADDMFA
jgi:hypothetical protein